MLCNLNAMLESKVLYTYYVVHYLTYIRFHFFRRTRGKIVRFDAQFMGVISSSSGFFHWRNYCCTAIGTPRRVEYFLVFSNGMHNEASSGNREFQRDDKCAGFSPFARQTNSNFLRISSRKCQTFDDYFCASARVLYVRNIGCVSRQHVVCS